MYRKELSEEVRQRIAAAKRVVFKVGTSTLVYPDTGKPNYRNMELLARVLSNIQNSGRQVALVSSGAIGVGRDKLRTGRPGSIPEKQAIASVGQCELMYHYSRFFAEYGKVAGQILLTRDVFDNEERRGNAENTFEKLFEMGIIPIVNENDSVSVDEIKFGDNDTLSALVALITRAELLVLISDIDGFYDCDPRLNREAKKLSVVENITPELEGFAGEKGSDNATGGMKTKIAAARIVTAQGIDMILTSGAEPESLYDVMDGKPMGTVFLGKRDNE